MRTTLLIIDDDQALVELLESYFTGLGYRVCTASNGEEGLQCFSRERPDLVILDVTMPKMDGWTTLRRIRERSHVPVIMLTVRNEEANILRGFTLGADDYVTKPFSFAELAARVRAVLSRVRQKDQADLNVLRAGDLVVDLTSRRVTRNGQPLTLTPTEFKLLVTLMEQPGRVFSPEEIVRKVWGPEYTDEVGYVRRYIWHLRKKIEPNPERPRYIHNQRGFGYYFQVLDEPSSEVHEVPSSSNTTTRLSAGS